MNAGRTVFAQLLDLLPRRAFESAVQRYAGHRKVRRFSCMDQLLCMIFAQITGRSSLRETVSCLKALGARRYHCGIRGPVSRSTLAEANEKRDFRIFMDLAMAMIAATRIDLPVDRELARLNADAYGLDSTTIDLCLKLFPWAHFRRRKGGIKAHTLLDLRVGIPVFLRVTHAKTHDLWALDQITPQAGAFFITRAKKNLDFGVRQRQPVNAATGVISDRFIRLRGPKSRGLYPDTLRLIRYVDPLTGKRLKFLTNNLTLAAATVALLYRKRWRIELFFKWIKATSAHQGVLRHQPQRREDSNLGGSDRVRVGVEAEASLSTGSRPERNIPNLKSHDSRKNAGFRALFRNSPTRPQRPCT
jgi:hypothetical protein